MINLDNLKQEDVQRNLTIIKQIVSELSPEIPVDRGPFHDLILYYSAMFATANQQDIRDVMQAVNVGRLLREPDSAHPAHVDRVLGNWLLARKKGTTSSGLVTLVLSNHHSVVIPSGTQFRSGEFIFRTSAIYQLRMPSQHMTDSDRLLMKQTKDTWTATIPVKGITGGGSSNLRRGTKLTFDKVQLYQVVKAYTANDFTGGADEEKNDEMLRRLSRHVSNKTGNNPYNYTALIEQHPKFDRLAGVSIVGYGDEEMRRDRHGLLPISAGGRVDVYVKTKMAPVRYTRILDGTKINGRPDGTMWLVSVGKEQAPGFIDIRTVKRIDGAKCEIFRDRKAFCLDDSKVDIEEPIEAVCSPFQTTLLTLFEPTTNTLDAAQFEIDFVCVDGLDELQKHLELNLPRFTSDVLVKAAIPCFTKVTVDISRTQYDSQVQPDVIKTAIVAAINGHPFPGHLTKSALLSAIGSKLTGTMQIQNLHLSGRLKYPDGEEELLSADTQLTIPDKPRRLISTKTVGFYQDPDDIVVNVLSR